MMVITKSIRNCADPRKIRQEIEIWSYEQME